MLPKKLQNKLSSRTQDNAFRHLGQGNTLVDFSSNDYLGFSRSTTIFEKAHQYLINHNLIQNGATGSRLLTGNHSLYTTVEQQISTFHNTESALIFNSGYDANVGFFSCVPQRNDSILYDEFCHASIRDGIKMSNAKAFKFKHNDLNDLTHQLSLRAASRSELNDVYIITESVFSMDGDSPDLKTLATICKKNKANLIIDEAHAIGIFGEIGNGLVNELQLEDFVFARIITFGKALGCHGAAILGHRDLKNYLINFSRAFIYTTALPPHSLATIQASYDEMLNQVQHDKIELQENISFFKAEIKRLQLQQLFTTSNSAIQCCIISGNDLVKHISEALKNNGFDVKAILSPTVPKAKERLRFCLHSYNTHKEITKVLELLTTFTP
ncbi:pyridoxal phosphate-dependent aminotransferase family protein [Psychroserpens burtonensis]|uniref:Pyridoxal phosphate-dependent aminotransferase family protein n=1 Tax=Psychroserpens burtonensis TaxID=49278 RepID=A0A5C7B732_9FLAO|nr:pyridoxal phosphate-dependent aminotransferase family protein [Psychroserpens burtonensis]TXE17819.1 pyridoxal phosphate-dependent aminotransferase family protein [Psychroserpens burtonensis]